MERKRIARQAFALLAVALDAAEAQEVSGCVEQGF